MYYLVNLPFPLSSFKSLLPYYIYILPKSSQVIN